MSDPAVWGPLIVALVVYLSATKIVQKLEAIGSKIDSADVEIRERLDMLREAMGNVEVAIYEVQSPTTVSDPSDIFGDLLNAKSEPPKNKE